MEKRELINVPVSVAFQQYPDIFNPKKIRPNRDDYNVDCPFCKRRGKLNVSNKHNVWRCAACGHSGNAVSLVAELENVSKSDAYKKLASIYDGGSAEYKASVEYTKKQDENEPQMAPLYVRDLVYRIMLDNCNLGGKHKKALMARGLTEEDIEKYHFRSVPLAGSYAVAQKAFVESGVLETSLRSKLNWAIPGFYTYGNDYRIMRAGPGVLVPVVWHDGKISCFQIRYDDLPDDATEKQKESFQRYKYFSSAWKKGGIGCTDIENVHFVGFDFESEATPEVVNLTEGALKADVASSLSGGKPFIAILGVNMQSKLPEVFAWLKEHGTKKINVMFDMDYHDKPEVADALKSLEKKLEESGLDWEQIKWNPKYKGIDDFLLARKVAKGE